jgi:hypothetical protein
MPKVQFRLSRTEQLGYFGAWRFRRGGLWVKRAGEHQWPERWDLWIRDRSEYRDRLWWAREFLGHDHHTRSAGRSFHTWRKQHFGHHNRYREEPSETITPLHPGGQNVLALQ